MSGRRSRGWGATLRFVSAAAAAAGAACRSDDALRDLPEAPEVLNTRVVFAPQCQSVIFSSNRDGRVAPFALEAPFTSAVPTRLAQLPDRDLLARSLSPDCKLLALVADQGGDAVYDVYLYDFTTRELTNLTRTRKENEGEPEFSPTTPVLAYLRNEELALYYPGTEAGVRVADAPAKFTSLEWSADGRRLFLEDRSTSIWAYDASAGGFTLIWQAPRKAYSPRSMRSYRQLLYFTSDHESEFSQVYELNLATSSLRRVHPSEHDQYTPRLRSPDELIFRTSIDGNVVALRLAGERVDTISPPAGVVYDLSLDFAPALFVYAGSRQIASIYTPADNGLMHDLLRQRLDVRQPLAREVRGRDGMVHFVFSADSQTRSWVVWLHGGPDEQVSPRYNLYFDFLARLGYGVVALNYPGSTGIGNAYELRGLPESLQVARQLAGIEEGLADVAAQLPGFGRYVLVGVSYGSAVGFRHLQRHPGDVVKFIDFSGVTNDGTRPDTVGVRDSLPPTLMIYGDSDPAQRTPARRELLDRRAKWMRTHRVELDDEGHFVSGRQSIRRILGEIERFLREQP